ncbi:MAG TPA: S41 family peptidase, partial [Gemmatimonadaceae bacterium]
SGDSAKMDAYYRQYQPAMSASAQLPFRNQTGGFDLVSIERADPRTIEFIAKERRGPTTAFGTIELSAGNALMVSRLQLIGLGPGVTAAQMKIAAPQRQSAIDGAIANLNEFYVFPDVAKAMGDTLRARLKRGAYDDATNGVAFANTLTLDLQSVSHDKHLRMNFAAQPIPDRQPGPPTPEMTARYQKQMEQINCGFVKVEQLAGNVGYVKFNMFADPAVCGPTASAAMNFVANSDALIIDLRDNGGGDPAMVNYLCSYLFSTKTHINDLWDRKSGSTREYWTSDTVRGKRLADGKPVYVLTSSRTFSGGEEFTYDLQTQKRATIVGETTGGGAHPVSGHRIDEHFMIGVPGARAINPITHTNWEGTGVTPDVKVPANDALTTAQRLISEKMKP